MGCDVIIPRAAFGRDCGGVIHCKKTGASVTGTLVRRIYYTLQHTDAWSLRRSPPLPCLGPSDKRSSRPGEPGSIISHSPHGMGLAQVLWRRCRPLPARTHYTSSSSSRLPTLPRLLPSSSSSSKTSTTLTLFPSIAFSLGFYDRASSRARSSNRISLTHLSLLLSISCSFFLVLFSFPLVFRISRYPSQ